MEGVAQAWPAVWYISPLNFLGSDTLSVQSRRLVFPMIESNTQFGDEGYRFPDHRRCMH